MKPGKKPKSKVDEIFRQCCYLAAVKAKGGIQSRVFQEEFDRLRRLLDKQDKLMYSKYFFEGLGKFPDELFKRS